MASDIIHVNVYRRSVPSSEPKVTYVVLDPEEIIRSIVSNGADEPKFRFLTTRKVFVKESTNG